MDGKLHLLLRPALFLQGLELVQLSFLLQLLQQSRFLFLQNLCLLYEHAHLLLQIVSLSS